MKIALDVMGGDNAPDINIEGVKLALNDFPAIEKIYLVGRENEVKRSCDAFGVSGNRVEIVNADEVVAMNESGLMAVRQKKNSSMSLAVDLVKRGDAEAVVSAGNTGAAVAASTIKLRLLKGVERAGILTPLPNDYGVCHVMDTGANPDAHPSHLVGYAMMGSIVAKHVQGRKMPKVGIMSNGGEDEKGTDFTKGTFALLSYLSRERELPFEFIGNVEGHDLFNRELDVVLTDGFTGNVLLKTCEATAKAFSNWLKIELKKSPIRMMGAVLASGAFSSMKQRLSNDHVGGCPLLGVNGLTIISHGSASGLAMKNALRIAFDMHRLGINPMIEEEMAKLGKIPNAIEH
ncbi:MAG: phosphate acyltransferase PlsX [Akkermansia sp.]